MKKWHNYVKNGAKAVSFFSCSDRKTYFCDIKMSMKPIF